MATSGCSHIDRLRLLANTRASLDAVNRAIAGSRQSARPLPHPSRSLARQSWPPAR